MINEEGANKVISEICCLQIELGWVGKLRLKPRILPRIRHLKLLEGCQRDLKKKLLQNLEKMFLQITQGPLKYFLKLGTNSFSGEERI